MMKFKKALVTLFSFIMYFSLFSILAHAQGGAPSATGNTDNLSVGTSESVEINDVTFPDEKFRESLVRRYDLDGDGKLSNEEISQVKVLFVFTGYGNDQVGSIKGIEYFSSLEELTIYENSKLTEIGLSQNKNIKKLSIMYCDNLYDIDLSPNTELTSLSINFCQNLKNIDLSNNTKLSYLNLQHTPIDVLDISNCDKLKELIDISYLSASKYDHSYVYKYSNLEYYIEEALIFDLDTKLIYLKSGELGNVVTTIDETSFPDELLREYVSLHDQNSDGKLTEKEIKTIGVIDFNGKQITSLKGIELLSSLKIIKVSECQLSELDVSHNTELEYLDCGGNAISELDISNNQKLRMLICRDNDIKVLDLKNNDLLNILNCSGNPVKIIDISETNIKVLECSNCELEELTCREGMLVLNCSNNNLSEIKNLSLANSNSGSFNNPDYYFYSEGFYGGQNYTECVLNCSNNKFSELNISGFDDLYDLNCSYNQLTQIDVRNNKNLYEFDCSNNNITQIDISNNTNLYNFYCSNNNLTQIDISNNINLYEFDCSYNNISRINIPNRLGWIYCSNNQLTEFDATNIEYGFNCSNNQIESLTFGGGFYFKCYNNKIKTLDVSNNSAKNYCYSWTKDGITFYTDSNWLNDDWTVDNFLVMSYLITDESTNVFPIEKNMSSSFLPAVMN